MIIVNSIHKCSSSKHPVRNGDPTGIAIHRFGVDGVHDAQSLALWSRGEASVREVQAALPEAPGYSTVRKIFERLEEKGAVERVRREGRAWIYRSTVSSAAMIRKEIRRLIDTLFDGSAEPLVSHLADMNAISLADLRRLEEKLDDEPKDTNSRKRAIPKKQRRGRK